ncbi:hypothetical protein [Brevifollis gellanilyticus]|uniref:Uncharacterized protein n=1 Tax=Brevifollis gellanilyticus TaxID=748831 RepID=A0A512MGB0_9BACT|nr:hypothetical protein [Brevifollis gellanilyticus]GEP45765.1 hypothetical protein BGE01nite_50560 [Brevifollis gellanilyticus]
MSEIPFSHKVEAEDGDPLLKQPCGFTVKAAVLDNRRRLIIEGWFHAAARDAEGGTLSPFLPRQFPFENDGEEIDGACLLQFERGTFPITQAFYCANTHHVNITREIPQKLHRTPRHMV